MKKLSSWLRACVLSTMAMAGTCATAQLPVRFDDGFWSPTNASPTVRIINPQEGAAFLLGDEIDICADVDHFSNHVAGVEFFAGTNELGVVTNTVGEEESDIYCLSLTNLAVGGYRLKAVATDTGGISATSAVVDISVVTNLPPRVHIVEPENEEVILGPTNVEVCAAAFDPDGTVTSVQFFSGTNSLGTVPAPPVIYVTNEFGVFPIKEPFCLTWSNAPVGAHVLTAVATDNGGATATSAPVSINIVTDLPPRVHIESPENGSSYLAPANIRISADASDPDGTVAKVQFFAGTNSLGVVTTPTVISNSWYVDSDYSLTWSNVPAGTYTLTAIAMDNAGMTSTSAPVHVTVFPPPSPKVTITYPRNGQIFFSAPRNINICAFERYFTNPIVNVRFFANSNSVGMTTNAPYSCIVWSNAPPGAYALTALATDSHGINATSAPVNINVVTNPPPSWSWRD